MIPTTSMYDSASTVSMELIQVFSSTINMFFLPLGLIFLGLILYYFSGQKKHAEEFMPKLMSVGLRLINYLWLLIGSITAFAGLYNVLFLLVAKLWPGDNAYVEPDSETFVRGLVTLLIGLIVISIHYVLNSKVNSKEELEGTVSKKMYISLGIIIFSLLTFVSLLTVSENILDNIYDEAYFVSASAISVMISSIAFWCVYLLQGLKTFRKELKK